MSVPATPFGVVTEVEDVWVNIHADKCGGKWDKDWSLHTHRNDRFIPPKFTFNIFYDGDDQDNYTEIEVTHCPFCGTELIHWIERQQRAKVRR